MFRFTRKWRCLMRHSESHTIHLYTLSFAPLTTFSQTNMIHIASLCRESISLENHICSTCYDMCTQRSPYNWSRELYQRHGETIETYLTRHVVPALREKSSQGSGSLLLTELQQRWVNHQIMNKWLKKFLTYLDRYYVKHHSLPTLSQAGLRCFRTHVYEEMKKETTKAILALIVDEREGKIIDKSLVRSIVELYE